MLFRERVISRAFVIQIRKCLTRKTSASQAWSRHYRNSAIYMDGAPATAPEVQEAERRIAHVPLVLNRRNFNWLTQRISEVVEQPAPRWWWVIFIITASAATFGLFCI